MALYIVLGLLLLLGIYFFKESKRRVAQPFPEKWHDLLLDNVLFYSKLPKQKQIVFQKRMMKFLSEVYIDGVQFEITDLDKIFVASSAVIPVFGFDEWHYYNLSGIILYPDHFNEDLEFADNVDSRHVGGLVGSGRFEKQMILSRKALHQGFTNTTDKNNTGIHEFVHLIDKMDGNVDGVPQILLGHQYTIPWLNLIHKKMEAINNDKSDIRAYGGTKQAEFFAVASEYFFERPHLFRRKHPELYKMMKACFRQKVKSE
ncbi:zinc-dependent peptidase [Flavobacterium salilacus subsp. salilacus]|uniref:M90 family metallopeptidase n=1 Tax=Flavobacterium TaxID=237 RepID=UPI001075407E|nr:MULTISPECIES: M90 family metallopeptidase [Flavobacterium]KAF2519589.1 zinc-dependent peptidase [Flavobacterium salilacus subsp. salilacus]MBE1614509.1 zinc-dependent peptidase [Flavobacterium sp. SaA2.13]